MFKSHIVSLGKAMRRRPNISLFICGTFVKQFHMFCKGIYLPTFFKLRRFIGPSVSIGNRATR
uniref:Uncharacterized protein n=1 Tax=Anguilla anguilla TaxID=7936 RepID=A0A0E9T035_ANGAN